MIKNEIDATMLLGAIYDGEVALCGILFSVILEDK